MTPWKLCSGALAVALFLAYVLPLVIKLKETSLAVVIALVASMMLVDLWQSLRSRED